MAYSRPDNSRFKTFSRRTAMIGGGQAVLMTVLAGRLYYLQVVESAKYKTLAEDNRISLRLIAPTRGRILDRFGVPVAKNRLDYRVVLIKEQVHGIPETLDAISEIIPISDSQRARIMRDIKRKPAFVPVTVSENLTWDQFATLNVHSPDLPGIQPDAGPTRDYPFKDSFSHVVGYVGAVTEDDLKGNSDPLFQIPGFKIGRRGVERVRDAKLRGKPGTSRVEVNAVGRVVRELARQEGTPGIDQYLTIDSELQTFAMERIKGESAAVVVMDSHTGDVLVMASSPGYDPNEFNIGVSQERWNQLSKDPYHPLINKCIAGQYPPGSTFKTMTALAGLESGAITPQTEIYCSGVMKLGRSEFHCWKENGHGRLDLEHAIMHSCDIYFYETARRTGVDVIAAMAKRFGLGNTLGLDIPGELKGLIPTAAWKQATLGVPWQGGETLITGIGQGYVLTTPLQLCTMVARLSNGGRTVSPHVLMSPAELTAANANQVDPPEMGPSLGIDPAHLAVVKAGMYDVSNVPGGTAFRSRIRKKGYSLAGKTGTSQVRRISKEERLTGVIKNKDKPWIERDHALFIAFGPVDAPRYAISVVVEHGSSGSGTAAPIAR
ncbi:MAG TPA: penicillin-binding protein 2, partial [Alphaproteobacteria bacterium]|nr:penicillin-binding protein 2 [Alphaproteobacteria bacterium]